MRKLITKKNKWTTKIISMSNSGQNKFKKFNKKC